MIGPTEIFYNPKPNAEWDRLLGATSEILNTGSTANMPNPEQVSKVVNVVNKLEDEVLEAARFRGLGYPLIGLAEALLDPEIYTEIVESSSELIAAQHWDDYGDDSTDGLRLREIEGLTIVHPFVEHTLLNRHKTPKETLLLADCLQYVARSRRANLKPADMLDQDDMEMLIEQGLSSTHAGMLAPQAASVLFRWALTTQFARDLGINYFEAAALKPLVLDIASPAEMEDIRLLKAAAGSANLRIDEFRSPIELAKYVFPEEDGIRGNFGFRFLRLKKPPKPVFNCVEDLQQLVIHEGRLGCPALYVRKLFELVLGMMPEIYIRADQVIKGEI